MSTISQPYMPAGNDGEQLLPDQDRELAKAFGDFLLTQTVGGPAGPADEIGAAFGAYLRDARKRRRLSVVQFADRTELTPATVHGLEHGAIAADNIEDAWLLRLAGALDEDVTTLRLLLGRPPRLAAAAAAAQSAPARAAALYTWYRRYYRLLLVLCDALMLAVAFGLAYGVRYGIAPHIMPNWPPEQLNHWIFCGGALVAMLFIFWLARLYDHELLATDRTEYPAIFYACTFGALSLIALGFAFTNFGVALSRGWLAGAWVFSIVLATGGRMALRHIAHRLLLAGYPLVRAVIVGAGAEAQRFHQRRQEMRRSVLQIAGFIDLTRRGSDAADERSLMGLPVLEADLKRGDDLPLIEHFGRVDELIVTERLPTEQWGELLILADRQGMRVRALLRDAEMLTRRKSGSLALANTPLVSVGNLRLSRSQHIVKRLFDVTVAGISLLLCAPLWLPVSLYALAHPGEPLYGRRRMYGLDGAEFDRLKFHVPAKGPLWLRTYRHLDLDSVPSLLNVLRGEMSVVGPEPLPTEMRDSFLHHPLLEITLRVRPGLTGEWRTLRRREQTVNEKLRLDIYYLSHYRFLLDLEVFFLRTLPLLPSIAAGTARHPKLREDRTEFARRTPSGSQVGSQAGSVSTTMN